MPAGAILRKTKLLSQHQGVQHIAVLFSGKAGTQVVALLSQPILARLYTPAQFGEFALLNSLLAILLIASCGRYEAGIVLTKKPAHAKRLFQLSQIVMAGFILLLSICILGSTFLPEDMLTAYKFPLLYLWLVPLLVGCSAYWQIVQNWLVRFRKYSQISFALIIQRLIILAGALLFALLPVAGNGLIYGLTIGSIIIFSLALYYQRHSFRVPLKSLRSFAHHFRDFPYFSVPTLLLSLFIQHLPVFWLSYFFDNSITGTYSMAYSLIMLPITALSMSAGQVFNERLAQKQESDRPPLILRICGYYALILFPAAALLWLGGEELMGFVLGSGWQKAGAIVSLLSPVVFCQGIAGCLMIALNVYRKQATILLFQLLNLLLLIIALSAGLYLQNILLTFKLIGLFSFLHLMIVSLFVYRTILQRKHEPNSKRILVN